MAVNGPLEYVKKCLKVSFPVPKNTPQLPGRRFAISLTEAMLPSLHHVSIEWLSSRNKGSTKAISER